MEVAEIVHSTWTMHVFSKASMRPRYGSRGNAGLLRHLRPMTGASMRPRYGSRGNRYSTTWFRIYLKRFNEAAIWKSRKSELFADIAKNWKSFNEAAIWKSRKSHPRSATHQTKTCFNEAAIWKSRKCFVWSEPSAIRHASMRPRYGSRGNILSLLRWAYLLLGFNEAAIWKSRKLVDCELEWKAPS